MDNTTWQGIYDEARSAGLTAATVKKPQTVAFFESDGLSPETDTTLAQAVQQGKQVWVETEGVCGFAWIHFPKWREPFEKWLVASGNGKLEHYPKNHVSIWVSEFNQSYERKVAYAQTFAAALQKHSITAYPGDRLD